VRPVFVIALAGWVTLGATHAGEPASPEELTDARARELVAGVAARVEAIRGMEFLRDVEVELTDAAGAREHVVSRLERFGERERLVRSARAWAQLGLLPADGDPLALLLDAVAEQAGGFYDPERGRYSLLSRLPTTLAAAVTAHELTHALEDQHYGLDARTLDHAGNDDRLFADAAVTEGSATLVMTAFIAEQLAAGTLGPDELQGLARLEAERAGSLERLPPALRRALIGPYVLGPRFLAPGGAGEPAGAIPIWRLERAYTGGPSSSEQILHPEKFWSVSGRDEPRPVSLAGVGRALGPGWTRSATGVLGEVLLAVLVAPDGDASVREPWLLAPEDWTDPAAAGWGGDRWELWEREGAAVTLLSTVWDTRADAREFADALRDREGLRLARRGPCVAIAAGSPTPRPRTLLARMLEAARVESAGATR